MSAAPAPLVLVVLAVVAFLVGWAVMTLVLGVRAVLMAYARRLDAQALATLRDGWTLASDGDNAVQRIVSKTGRTL